MGIEIDIGKRIKSYREAAGLHQEDLARMYYVRAVKANKLDSMDDILRFAEPGLKTSTSSAAAIGLFLIRHRTASYRVYCMVLLVCVFQAQGLLSPATALLIVAFSAALPLIGTRLNKAS